MVFVGLLWSTPFWGHNRGHVNSIRICAPKMKLNARQIETAKPKEKAYKMADGGGLYLEVSPKGSKYWRMKYRRPSDKRKIGSLLVYTRRSLWLRLGLSAMQQRNCCLRALTPKWSKRGTS